MLMDRVASDARSRQKTKTQNEGIMLRKKQNADRLKACITEVIGDQAKKMQDLDNRMRVLDNQAVLKQRIQRKQLELQQNLDPWLEFQTFYRDAARVVDLIQTQFASKCYKQFEVYLSPDCPHKPFKVSSHLFKNIDS